LNSPFTCAIAAATVPQDINSPTTSKSWSMNSV
jgi:hypothetical protein